MSNDPMEASNTTEGPDHLKDMRKVKICDIHGSWPIREVHVDTTAVCCTTTRSFVEASDKKVALSVLKTDYKCQNPDHVDAIRLQVRGVDSYDPDCITLCVLEDERSYAVMTGTEPCFKPQSEGEEHIGVIKTKVITEAEKPAYQAADEADCARVARQIADREEMERRRIREKREAQKAANQNNNQAGGGNASSNAST